MNKDNRFILVSAIAFLSLSYIFFINTNNFVFRYDNNEYAAVMSASQSRSTTITASSSTKVKFTLPPESPVNYTDNKNGTITDNYTGLIWKKCPQGISGNDCKGGSPSLREWSKARVECEELSFAGKKGWRIPSLKELQSIVDTGVFDPSINKNFFGSSNDPYWTLTSPAEYPGSKFTVLFSDGSVYYSSSNNIAATRCIYDGNVK